jgi:catechol 2,3-dioxygenase-like lactoylglutathione lyase family enzyme
MTVRRIVANLHAADPGKARAFYQDRLGLDLAMDHGWILTLACGAAMAPQLSIASEGGWETPVPGLSIEVADVDIVYRQAKAAGLDTLYALTDEPRGVRGFFVRDPLGTIVNILSHPTDQGRGHSKPPPT